MYHLRNICVSEKTKAVRKMANQQPLLLFRFQEGKRSFSESAAELSEQRKKQKSKITKKAIQGSFLCSVNDADDFDW